MEVESLQFLPSSLLMEPEPGREVKGEEEMGVARTDPPAILMDKENNDFQIYNQQEVTDQTFFVFPSFLPMELEPGRELKEEEAEEENYRATSVDEEENDLQIDDEQEISGLSEEQQDTGGKEGESAPECIDSINPPPSEDDKELTSNSSTEIDRIRSVVEELEDDNLVPSELLEEIDHSSVVYALGTKYNCVVKNCQEEKEKNKTLMKKYNQEYAQSKRLYNENMELKGNIRVFCRFRPLSSEEVSKGYTSSFDFDPSQDRELQIICSDNSRKQFKFDHVFSPQANQEMVFAETLPIIRSVLDGYNACIFAYGQTGTGKTFTMEGTEENRGVNYRTLEELFRISSERSSTLRNEFFVSMLEVYNEKIRDLLLDSSDEQGKKLDIKQAAEGTQEIPGLTEAQAYNTEEVWKLLGTGQQNRSVGSTAANELSSRSHCLLRVTVKGENLLNGQRTRSHLWLVDLAGSERVGKIEVGGERLKESQFINKSLSALGDVISALASKNQHIPYRNSKLTHLLQSSLGGDCKTLMFVQISPSSSDVGETLCSLNFATRVQGVEHGPVRKQHDMESFKCKQMAEKLRHEEKENARLNENLQMMHLKYASRESVIKNLNEKVKDLESQLLDAKRARSQQENKENGMKALHDKFNDLENQLYDTRRKRPRWASKDSSKLHKPPLPSIKEKRQPLKRITNVLVLPPTQKFRRSVAITNSYNNTEDIFKKNNVIDAPPHPMKTQRVSFAPRRRVSVASLSNPVSFRSNDKECSNDNSGVSLASRRRVSIASFANTASFRLNDNENSNQNSSMQFAPRRLVSIGSFPNTSSFRSDENESSNQNSSMSLAPRRLVSIGSLPNSSSFRSNDNESSNQNSSMQLVPRRRVSIASFPNPESLKSNDNESSNQHSRAQLLAPRRRESIASLPNPASLGSNDNESSNQSTSMSLANSVLSFRSRRMSFVPLPSMAPLTTPDTKGKFSSSSIIRNSSKYSSPSQSQQRKQQLTWVSKIPTLASPRRMCSQRLRLMPSPRNMRTEMTSKFCFSVQKRVAVGSPAQLRRPSISGMPSLL